MKQQLNHFIQAPSHLIGRMKPTHYIILLQLLKSDQIRKGKKKDKLILSLSRIENFTKLSHSTVLDGLKVLKDNNIIKVNKETRLGNDYEIDYDVLNELENKALDDETFQLN